MARGKASSASGPPGQHYLHTERVTGWERVGSVRACPAELEVAQGRQNPSSPGLGDEGSSRWRGGPTTLAVGQAAPRPASHELGGPKQPPTLAFAGSQRWGEGG